MKKYFLPFIVIFFILSSCSSDDNSSNSAADNSFVSKIVVDNKSFVPLENTDDIKNIVTSFESGVNNGQANVRTFHLFKLTSNLSTSESLQLSIIYPISQSTISGTYSLKISDIEVNTAAQGSYTLGFNSYSLDNGTLSIVDLGNSKFKLTFNNARGTNPFDDSSHKTIAGYCEGTFAVEQ